MHVAVVGEGGVEGAVGRGKDREVHIGVEGGSEGSVVG